MAGSPGQRDGAEGQGERRHRGRLRPEGHADSPSDALRDPVRQCAGCGRAEPEHAGSGHHRELEPQGSGETRVGQQQHDDGEGEGPPSSGAAPSGDAEEHQPGHHPGPEDARLPPGDDDQHHDQEDPDHGQSSTAHAGSPGQPEPGGQDDRQVGAADRHEMGQPGRTEVPLQLRRE